MDQVQTFVSQTQSGDPAIDGVACAQCHLIKQIDRTSNPPKPKYEPGKTLFGPYKDFVENKAHQSMELELFRKSDLCLNCHLSVPAAVNLGKSNDLLGNWENSPTVKSGKECQTCHMPEQVGESNGRTSVKWRITFPGDSESSEKQPSWTWRLVKEPKRRDGHRPESGAAQSSTAHPGWAKLLLDLTIRENRQSVREQQFAGDCANTKGKTVFDFEAARFGTPCSSPRKKSETARSQRLKYANVDAEPRSTKSL
jgi:hypothetical protein